MGIKIGSYHSRATGKNFVVEGKNGKNQFSGVIITAGGKKLGSYHSRATEKVFLTKICRRRTLQKANPFWMSTSQPHRIPPDNAILCADVVSLATRPFRIKQSLFLA